MASSHGNTHSEPAKMEQIITEFFAKSLHIILESRSSYVSSRNYSGEQTVSSPSSSSSSSSSIRPRDRWFNLALRDSVAALENIDLWRQSNLEPMFIDVILLKKPIGWDPVQCSPRRDIVRNLSQKEPYPSRNPDQEEFSYEAKTEKIIERWVVQYESRKSRESSSGSKRPTSNSSHILYKKAILLFRSLYAMVRLLPAYKLFRELNSSGQILTFTLAHRVSSFVEPFTRREEAEMQRFGFTPLDTSCGRLCLSVIYCSSLTDVSSEPSTPIPPQFIPDYVGSPMADPLRRFPSLPVSQSSPSCSPFGRRHSWSYDQYRASPPLVSFSPSPTYSESRASNPNSSTRRLPPMSLPPHPPEANLFHKKNASFEEFCFSPPFSTSPSASPPAHISGIHPSKAFPRADSAPVTIPGSKFAYGSGRSNKQILPPSPPLRGTRLSVLKTEKDTGLEHTSAKMEKLLSLGKDESGRYGVKIPSNNSPRISVSRSSSRQSIPDDFDDSDFAAPFFVDDDDMMEPPSRPESFNQKGHMNEPFEPGGPFPVKSQDAAVGALVQMLKAAPPLCRDSTNSINLPQSSKPEIWNTRGESNQISSAPELQQTALSAVVSSGLAMSRTTADAFEELKSYREMKELLLKQGVVSQTLSDSSAAESSSRGTAGF
ncbi:Autophagy-related protein 13, N-terminal [Dillenia turbinata]|uniref:Autophagy-related protein 13, N-terminal n=1 Tax=Dillenia turbinata TaxID=194707 RepID=A0AAN8V3W1_9MAGN